MSEQRLRQPRAAISFLGAMPEAIAVQTHERGFAAGEERSEDEQSRQCAKKCTQGEMRHWA